MNELLPVTVQRLLPKRDTVQIHHFNIYREMSVTEHTLPSGQGHQSVSAGCRLFSLTLEGVESHSTSSGSPLLAAC